MSDTITVHDLTHPTRELQLPCGQTVATRKLTSADWHSAMGQFNMFLDTLTVLLNADPTPDDLITMMPAVLMDTFLHPVGREAIHGFLRAFAEALTAEQMDGWSLGDYEAIWERAWEYNRGPFVMALQRGGAGGRYKGTRELWTTLQTNLEELPMTENLLASSSEPASTPETAASPSSTSPRRRRRNTNLNSGMPRG